VVGCTGPDRFALAIASGATSLGWTIEKLSLATELDAVMAIDAGSGSVGEQISELTGGLVQTPCLEASGSPPRFTKQSATAYPGCFIRARQHSLS